MPLRNFNHSAPCLVQGSKVASKHTYLAQFALPGFRTYGFQLKAVASGSKKQAAPRAHQLLAARQLGHSNLTGCGTVRALELDSYNAQRM